MFYLVDALYEWDPRNIGSAYNIGHNLDRAANSLQHIDQSVTSIRNSIWANQFLGAMREYQAIGQQKEFEAQSTLVNKIQLLDELVGDLLALFEKVMEKGQIRQHLAEEFKRNGEAGFLKILGYNDFMRYLDDYAPMMTSNLESMLGDMQEFRASDDDPYAKSDYLDSSLLPQLEEISVVIADLDCKLEIMIDLMKSGLGITRMFAYKESLMEEAQDGLEKLKSGTIELPFNYEELERSLATLDEEVKLLTDLLTNASDEQLIINEDHVRIAGWAPTVEFRFDAVSKAFEDIFEKLKDFKRIYEMYWFKNN
jgi:hypothetical protein